MRKKLGILFYGRYPFRGLQHIVYAIAGNVLTAPACKTDRKSVEYIVCSETLGKRGRRGNPAVSDIPRLDEVEILLFLWIYWIYPFKHVITISAKWQINVTVLLTLQENVYVLQLWYIVFSKITKNMEYLMYFCKLIYFFSFIFLEIMFKLFLHFLHINHCLFFK